MQCRLGRLLSNLETTLLIYANKGFYSDGRVVARSVKNAKLILKVAANANGFTELEPGRSFGVTIQSNRNRMK